MTETNQKKFNEYPRIGALAYSRAKDLYDDTSRMNEDLVRSEYFYPRWRLLMYELDLKYQSEFSLGKFGNSVQSSCLQLNVLRNKLPQNFRRREDFRSKIAELSLRIFKLLYSLEFEIEPLFYLNLAVRFRIQSNVNNDEIEALEVIFESDLKNKLPKLAPHQDEDWLTIVCRLDDDLIFDESQTNSRETSMRSKEIFKKRTEKYLKLEKRIDRKIVRKNWKNFHKVHQNILKSAKNKENKAKINSNESTPKNFNNFDAQAEILTEIKQERSKKLKSAAAVVYELKNLYEFSFGCGSCVKDIRVDDRMISAKFDDHEKCRRKILLAKPLVGFGAGDWTVRIRNPEEYGQSMELDLCESLNEKKICAIDHCSNAHSPEELVFWNLVEGNELSLSEVFQVLKIGNETESGKSGKVHGRKK